MIFFIHSTLNTVLSSSAMTFSKIAFFLYCLVLPRIMGFTKHICFINDWRREFEHFLSSKNIVKTAPTTMYKSRTNLATLCLLLLLSLNLTLSLVITQPTKRICAYNVSLNSMYHILDSMSSSLVEFDWTSFSPMSL